MVYKKNIENSIDIELFRNPTSEYRGAPFWAWNCKLDKNELEYQIECLKDMGFGGFFMHSRSGMATEYLGKEFLDIVKFCVNKAKNEKMLSWLYDEDRWPSGSAGGYVTKNKKYRQKVLEFTSEYMDTVSAEEGYENGKPYLLACYDVELNLNDGTLKSYKKIDLADSFAHTCWYAYVKTAEEQGWFNGQTYVDTMSKEAMQEFIKVTYLAYNECVGAEFGKNIHAIFTDEPQFAWKEVLPFATSKGVARFPWTNDFADSFAKVYGFNIIDYLPELVWNLPKGKVSKSRYCYHDHCCERFTVAFADQLGGWCKEHKLSLTGHLLGEPTLVGQTRSIGEAMRAYRSFGIPGIDMLCDLREYTTVKQAQSIKNQSGYEALASELYGVTNWDFDFRGYKLAGDWQAALGVTLRVPHLSWVSMKGAAKRDYPASFNYQAPWYKKFSIIEDHFARVNTVLTRGKPIVRLGVIHPIESAWIHYGPGDTSKDLLRDLDDDFKNLTEWLLFGLIDFDFICESLLPEQFIKTDKELYIGEMCYDAILLPPLKTIRKTTLDILWEYYKKGAKLIFIGEYPRLVDAEESELVKTLYDRCGNIQFSKMSVLSALGSIREVEIRNKLGEMTDYLIYNMREECECKYLFIANGRREMKDVNATYLPRKERNRPYFKDVVECNEIIIKIRGEYKPTLMNTLAGTLIDVEYEIREGNTYIPYSLYAYDSLLFRLDKSEEKRFKTANDVYQVIEEIDFRNNVPYKREEKNVFILDMAEYALDNEELHQSEEILRIDDSLRKRLNLQRADGCEAQPWVFEEKPPENYVTLRFEVYSEIDCIVELAYEEMTYLAVNGEEIAVKHEGYYVDKSIRTMSLPPLKIGTNEIIIKAPIGKRVSVENYYIIGDFDVKLTGCEKVICSKSERLAFQSITNQGMPFYGGNISYYAEINAEEDCEAEIIATYFRGEMIEVIVDGKSQGNIFIMPYSIRVPNVKKGKHLVEFKLYGNRFNTFGALHNCGDNDWAGPEYWYTRDSEWCYEYNVRTTGILKSPVIKLLKKMERDN